MIDRERFLRIEEERRKDDRNFHLFIIGLLVVEVVVFLLLGVSVSA